jgi:hypothetical protein
MAGGRASIRKRAEEPPNKGPDERRYQNIIMWIDLLESSQKRWICWVSIKNIYMIPVTFSEKFLYLKIYTSIYSETEMTFIISMSYDRMRNIICMHMHWENIHCYFGPYFANSMQMSINPCAMQHYAMHAALISPWWPLQHICYTNSYRNFFHADSYRNFYKNQISCKNLYRSSYGIVWNSYRLNFLAMGIFGKGSKIIWH